MRLVFVFLVVLNEIAGAPSRVELTESSVKRNRGKREDIHIAKLMSENTALCLYTCEHIEIIKVRNDQCEYYCFKGGFGDIVTDRNCGESECKCVYKSGPPFNSCGNSNEGRTNHTEALNRVSGY